MRHASIRENGISTHPKSFNEVLTVTGMVEAPCDSDTYLQRTKRNIKISNGYSKEFSVFLAVYSKI